MSTKSKCNEVDSAYGKTFTYLGVLLEQQEDGSIRLYLPQYIENIIYSEYCTKEYSTPADEHLFNEDPSARQFDELETKALLSTSSYFGLSLDSNKRISFRLAHDASKSSTYRMNI